MKNYLITGSGGSLAQEFLKKNYNAENYFYLLYNKRKPNIFNKNKNIKYLKFNFKDSRKINKFLSKKFNSKNNIDVIVNFAGSASPSKKINTLNYLDINEIYSINLFTPLPRGGAGR